MFKGIFSLLATMMISRFMGQPPAVAGSPWVSSAILRKVSVMFVLITVGSLLFFGGFLTVLVDLILASYTLGQVTLTNLSWVGFGLMLIAALIYSVAFSERFWRPLAQPEVHASPLSAALANLINDFHTGLRKQHGDSGARPAYMS